MKKLLRVAFGDFWQDFAPGDNLFTRLLAVNYDVVLDQRRPDLLIYTPYTDFDRYRRCRKIFWTSECDQPDYRDCHGSLTFEPNDRRNVYFPVWLLNHDLAALAQMPTDDAVQRRAEKTRWNLFLVSNPHCQYRIDLFRAFDRHRHVDSPGKVCNNMPPLGGDARDLASTAKDPAVNWHARKQGLLRRYQFNLAAENQASPGYVTEKMVDALAARVVPIYWGAPDIARYFNPAAFIHARDFPDLDTLARHVIAVGDDDERYLPYLRAPIFPANRVPDFLTFDFLAGRLGELVEQALREPPIGRPFSYRLRRAATRARQRVHRLFR
jgi:alpha(1,3/1,4) fucosyltransferase